MSAQDTYIRWMHDLILEAHFIWKGVCAKDVATIRQGSSSSRA